MTTYQPTRRPLSRSARHSPPRSRGPSALLIAVAIVLFSVGFGLTLLPGVSNAGFLILVPATLLLLAGLDGSVRESLREEG
ncbi:hypothetical protein [Brachybacterium sp.]|uniref:hypothetical protein n=1 Tax=Brachybacterium sp. TaxID=1891286 RepID=UPI002ED227BE